MEQTEVQSLPDFQSEYELTEEQISYYQANGHIVLRNVASQQEVDTYRPIFKDVVMAWNNHTKPVHERDTYGKAFIQIGNLWQKSEALKRYVMGRRFAKIAAELMGVDGVRIYHDQALYKEPGGGHTPWHQDQIYWPLDTPHTITMWMPLVPVSEEIGSMIFANGSHKFGKITRLEISDTSHKTLKDFIEHHALENVSHGAMAAGDATFHAGWTLHSAPGNPTDTMREVMTVIYVADGERICEPDSNARRNDMASWFPGLGPGDLAASPLNPLVYKRS